MFGLIGCGFLFIPLLLLVWAVITVVRAITLPRNAARFAACERCGYAVADLTSFTCPECGVDLRLGGIITPAIIARGRGSLTTAILAWTYIAGFFGYFALTIGIATIGFGMGAGAWAGSMTTGWSNNLTPNSGNYRSVEIIFDTDFSAITSDIELNLVDNAGIIYTITLDPNTDLVTGLASGPTSWSPTTIETWYAETGLDITDTQLLAEAAEVTKEIDLAIRSPGMGMNSTNLRHHTSTPMPVASSTGAAPFATGFGPSTGVWLAATGVGLLLYLLGILYIVRRRNRLLRSLRA